ncbi:hypothetical protein AVEN_78427-1 [Araneus ventricosus]|uniref:Uncharacterized protein n=1 Tax=Araneus ventricosus TaxID=182803 RepID=A0A4Y2WHB9_ARAVE|nr:hypothetical protein AVEN_78427-1 [Araneus ventricosus]
MKISNVLWLGEIASNPDDIFKFLCTSLRSNNESLAPRSEFLLVQLFTLIPQKYEFLPAHMRRIMRKVDSVPFRGLLESSLNVTPESSYPECQGSLNCTSQ